MTSHDDSIPAAVSPSDIIIPIMGTTGAGKSSFIQLCTKEQVNIGHGLMSCTAQCMMYSLKHRGHTVRLVDTPGFDDSTRSEIDILGEIALWLNMAYVATPKLLLSGLIYLHPINEPKMQGSAKRNLNMFQLLCGESNLQSVVLATTMWEKVTPAEGEKRLQELISTRMFWGGMVEQGSQVVRHENNSASAMRIIDHFIDRRKSIILDIQKQMIDGQQTLEQTSAGHEQLSGLLKDKKKAEQRLHRNEQEVAELLRQHNQQQAAILQAEQERYKKLIEERQASIAALKMDMDELKRQKQAQWKREEEEIARARLAHETHMAKMRRDMEDLARQQQAARAEAETIRRQRAAAEEEERKRLERQRQQEKIRLQQQSQADRARVEAEAKRRQQEAEYWARKNQQAAQAAMYQQQQLEAERMRMQQQWFQMQQQQYALQQAEAFKIQQQSSLSGGFGMGDVLQYAPHVISGINSAANMFGAGGMGLMGSAAAAGACCVM